MMATRMNTTIEIWGAEYINNPSARAEQDQDARIVQIEACVSVPGDYMVEVLRHD